MTNSLLTLEGEDDYCQHPPDFITRYEHSAKVPVNSAISIDPSRAGRYRSDFLFPSCAFKRTEF
jgi:hypothetical protein